MLTAERVRMHAPVGVEPFLLRRSILSGFVMRACLAFQAAGAGSGHVGFGSRSTAFNVGPTGLATQYNATAN